MVKKQQRIIEESGCLEKIKELQKEEHARDTANRTIQYFKVRNKLEI